MVGSLVVPRILSVPGSSVSLTVMARLVSDRGLFRNKSRISENGVGLIRLSGCIISKNIDKFPSVDVVRLVALGLDGLHRWGPWSFGGWWWFGMSGYFEVVGEDEGRCPLFISQTVSSIFEGCLWPDRSGSGHDEGKVRPSTVQSHPRTALNILL